ncbi:MAG: hypothetical protein GW914_02720, partial [Candidatus Aenigmarchaeota archaeon]|nr:hypothetical protein [Candidatus Aenigmarchaeota archaeon]
TEISGIHRSRNWIYVNTSVTEVNPANITFRLYNSTQDLVNSTYFNSANLSYSLNFTDISDIDELYYYNATIYDNSSWSNSTPTRTITLDTTNAQINFVSPTDDNASHVDRDWTYINTTITDLYPDTFIVNWNGTNYTFSNNTYYINMTSQPEGTYQYYAWVNDTAGNINTTETRTIYINPDSPSLTIDYPTEASTVNQTLDINTTPVDQYLDKVWWNLYWVNASAYITQNNFLNASSFDTTYNTLTLNNSYYRLEVFANDSNNNSVYQSTNFTIYNTNTSFSDISVNTSTGGWGEWYNFTVYIDAYGDSQDMTVKLYKSDDNSTWIPIASSLCQACDQKYASVYATFNKSDMGSLYYKFETVNN